MAKVAKKAWLWPYLPGFTRPHFPGKPGQKPGKPGLASLFQACQVFGRAPDARAGFMLVLLFSFFIVDLDECKDKIHQCDVNANCTNIPGSYNCTCRPGYTGNGSICNGIICYPSLHFIFFASSYVFLVT